MGTVLILVEVEVEFELLWNIRHGTDFSIFSTIHIDDDHLV